MQGMKHDSWWTADSIVAKSLMLCISLTMGVSVHPVVWEYPQVSLISIQNAASAIDFSSPEK